MRLPYERLDFLCRLLGEFREQDAKRLKRAAEQSNLPK
jgi:hypothetical protein